MTDRFRVPMFRPLSSVLCPLSSSCKGTTRRQKRLNPLDAVRTALDRPPAEPASTHKARAGLGEGTRDLLTGHPSGAFFNRPLHDLQEDCTQTSFESPRGLA
jgi:hypothetical protein